MEGHGGKQTYISATNSMRRMRDISLKNFKASSRVVEISVGIFSVSKWYLTGERVQVTVLSFLFSYKKSQQLFLELRAHTAP
jgi:hypothetical protein